ncbi:MAG: BlaI/MecI/CopY family transcriptional regulator [Prevotellaceae bacterium]|nr:BlaI/MecI/CopY family transcriptional regulator [Prevotellaceae bacterium]
MEKLTIQEEDAMLAVWKTGKGFIKDFMEHFPDPKPPYTTLASVIKNLERKGYLKAVRYGNTFEYSTLIDECEYKRKFMSGFVRDYFKNSYKDLVAFFIEGQELSREELKELVNMIEHNAENSKP